MALRYERPATISEARALLAERPERTVVLAGGTDLLIKLRSGTAPPALVVDIKRIPGMREIRWTPEGDLVLGAAVTMRAIHADPRVLEAYPALAEGADAVGSLQIRYRATVGGNLCNASPCMDTAPPLLVLGARLTVVGPGGERSVDLDGFFVDAKRTVLAPGELVVSITVPAASRRLECAFDKIKRGRGHDLALVNAAVAHDPGARTLRGAIGSCGATPILLPEIVHEDGDPAETGERLAAAAREAICPIDDVRASAEYRQDMAALLCRRLTARVLGPHAGRR